MEAMRTPSTAMEDLERMDLSVAQTVRVHVAMDIGSAKEAKIRRPDLGTRFDRKKEDFCRSRANDGIDGVGVEEVLGERHVSHHEGATTKIQFHFTDISYIQLPFRFPCAISRNRVGK